MGQLYQDRKGKRTLPYPAPKVTEVTRLTPQVYAALRKQLGGNATAFATQQTTEIQAGFMLGINHVLNVLQEGFVIESPAGKPI